MHYRPAASAASNHITPFCPSVQDRQCCQPGLPGSAYAPDYDMNSLAVRIRGPDETAVRWLIRTQVSGLLTGFLPYRL